MTVRKSDRTIPKNQFLKETTDLEIKTIRYTCNEKVVPKRFRNPYGSKLMELAIDVNTLVREANYTYVSGTDEETKKNNFRRRQENQYKAYEKCGALLSQINILPQIFPQVSMGSLKDWSDTAIQAKTQIKNWIESDRERFSKYI